MRRFVYGLILSAFATLAQAQTVLPPSPEIQDVITGQFDAFASRDAERAFGYASPAIQGFFDTANDFAQMVQQGYPMVWSHQAMNFVDLQNFGGLIVQRVEVTDSAGQIFTLAYQMIQTPDGWRINAVQILQQAFLGT
jgi:hypothetical protein